MSASKLNLRYFYLLLLTIGLSLIVPKITSAQTITPAMMTQISTELQKRGLTESEVRVRLLQKGIDLESIPPAELPQYQARVIAVLDELQAEKKAAAQINLGDNATRTASAEPETTKQEAAAEAARKVLRTDSSTQNESVRIYGHSLFSNQTLEVFRTTDGAQAPETYILGEGDEIRITIFGASQTDILQKISADGSIQPTGVAKIFLKGLSLMQAREVIKDRLSSAYTFRSDQLAVTISTARTILVNVFGEAKMTGGFTVSALNSALNALTAAGGPTAIGSVRNIQLIRGNSRKTIDLYTFMNDPAAQFKFDLQSNDILFVPVIKQLVTIEGAVKRPMSYEMLPNETLIDLINYAGDVNMNVFPDFVQIQRYINGEQRLFEYNLEDVRSGKTKVALKNGDLIKIKSIGKPMDQYVDIEGSVYYPGRFDLASNPSLRALLAIAKPTYQAKTDVLFIERTRPDETIEILTLPFPSITTAENDVQLQARDKIRIMDQASYRDVATIAVNGQVRNPFEKSFSLNDKITINQAIELAGGLKSSVYPVAYIFRKNIFNPVEVEYIRIELGKDGNKLLQAGDQLNIYDNSTYTNVGEVKVFGAVKNPGGLTFDPSLSVRDVLTHAGGFNLGAALNRVEIFRTILSPTEKTRIDMITLQVDSSYQVVSPENFKLQPFDQLVVRLTPEFTLGRTIEINGQVKYPGVYALESKQTHLSEVIRMAGGLLGDADPTGSGLFRTYRNRGNITMDVKKALSNAGNIELDPILFENDVININRRENTVSIYQEGTRMAQYSIFNDTTDVKNVIFQGRKSARWYIRNFAGGFEKRANRNSVTVTLPNNQMTSTKRHLLVFRDYPTVQPGSVISLQMKPEKDKLANGEKTDWDSIMTRTTASITATVTLFLLFRNLGL